MPASSFIGAAEPDNDEIVSASSEGFMSSPVTPLIRSLLDLHRAMVDSGKVFCLALIVACGVKCLKRDSRSHLAASSGRKLQNGSVSP